ncbi:MAG: IS3 family transposase, partial [Candidatus Methanoperedens sp.]|nr:IS3 family transposase [Candidatus Methanoperedens sp.]
MHPRKESAGRETEIESRVKFMIISENLDIISINRATELLDVSRSGYYKWMHKQNNGDHNSDISIREEMQNIVIEFPGYGYRRVKVELRNRGYVVNEKKVRCFMKEDNLICVKKRFKLQTTDSNHGEKVYPNLARNLNVTDINQLWVADITYIQLSKEFVYLAVIIDVFSRRCIGWDLSRNIDTHLTLNALLKALQTRKADDLKNLIHHSDQGVQYASIEYVNYLKDICVQISMSRKGNPYDNAFAESFMKTLKYEEVYLNEYGNFNDAIQNIEHFIEEVYNS